jgi:hypothetical protein
MPFRDMFTVCGIFQANQIMLDTGLVAGEAVM